MTESQLSQETSDVLDSDLNFNQTPKIQFLLSGSSIVSSRPNLNKQPLNRTIEGSQFSLETIESLSTTKIFDQQDLLINNNVSEKQSSLNSPSPLSQNLLSILQPPEQKASCLNCGQTGCGCSAQRYPQQKQEQNIHSKQHSAGNTSNHDDHGHAINGLEDDFPIWNTVANTNTATSITASASVAISNTFRLHSNPNAQHTIYLDFNGHTTSGTWWNDGETIQSSAYNRDGNSASFSNSELLEIQSIWQQVAEDFAPFNVNVTTQDPGVEALRKTSSSDRQWGVRVLFTDNRNDLDGTAIAAGAGGIAYIGSFNRNVDQPVFVFNKGARAAAVTASHEVGHSLYLRHDGISGQTSYHPGHGSGATSWGSIMGAPFQENLTQWSRGDYYNADNTEDDLAIITTKNGFGYRSDDHGNNTNDATTLTSNNSDEISAFGIIERNTDIDYFSFTTGAGNVSLTIAPASKAWVTNGGGYASELLDAQGANLDIWAGLYNSSGTLLASSNPSNLLTASFDLSLAAGNYFIRVDGVGLGNPLAKGSQGYSDYGSLGQYVLAGTIQRSVSQYLAGQNPPDYLRGGSGNDKVYGFDGNDTLLGEAGNDTLVGGNHNDYLYGHAGRDYLVGNSGNDKVYGQDDNDTLIGGAGHDTLAGGAGNDTLSGGDHNDYLYGHAGQDYLAGNSGNDKVYGHDGNDTLLGGTGYDNLLGGNHNDYLYGQAGRDLLSGNSGNDKAYGHDDIDTLMGGTGNDTLSGGNHNDYLYGQAGQDYLLGDSGNDKVYGQDGNDTLIGGAGNDTLVGGNHDDYLYGHAGRDYLLGDSGNDKVYGQDDNDTLIGGAGNDTLVGGAGNDTLSGGDHNDYLYGQTGRDYLSGHSGNDKIYGQDDNDTLVGGAGNDTLSGGAGNDLLVGSGGNDVLVGGSGIDRFALTAVNHGVDIFNDFAHGTDRIQISQSGFSRDLSIGSPLKTNQFHLGSRAILSTHRFLYESTSGRLFFDQDGNGSSGAVHVATLRAQPGLSSQDFLITG